MGRPRCIFLLLFVSLLLVATEAGIKKHLLHVEDHPHNDASTGTITEMTEEQEASTHAAMTCDKIMARSVVLANEHKAEAQEERDAAVAELKVVQEAHAKLKDERDSEVDSLTKRAKELQGEIDQLKEEAEEKRKEIEDAAAAKIEAAEQELKTVKENTAKEIKQAKADFEAEANKAKEAAARSIEEIKNQMEEAKLTATENMKKAKTKWDETLADHQKKSAEALKALEDKANEIQTNADALLEREKSSWDATKAQMEQEHADHVEDLDKKAKSALAASENARDEKISELKKELEETKVEHGEAVKELTGKAEKEIQDLKSNHSDATAELETKHENEKSQLVKLLEETKETSKNDLEETKADHTKRIALLRQSSQKELVDITSSHDKEKTKLEKKINELESKEKLLGSDLSQTREKLEETLQELSDWEALHSERSYCNLTHIHEDTAAAVLSATKVASQQVTQLADPHLKKGRELYDQHLKDHVDKHYQTASQLYDKHLKEHVDKHIVPLHESHVIPGLNYLQDSVNEACRGAFNVLVQWFEKGCREARPHVDGWLLDSLRAVCKDPAIQVERILWITFVIVLFLTRRLIYRLVVGIIWLKLKTLWYMTLVPFVLGLFRRKKPAAATQSNGSVRSNGSTKPKASTQGKGLIDPKIKAKVKSKSSQ